MGCICCCNSKPTEFDSVRDDQVKTTKKTNRKILGGICKWFKTKPKNDDEIPVQSDDCNDQTIVPAAVQSPLISDVESTSLTNTEDFVSAKSVISKSPVKQVAEDSALINIVETRPTMVDVAVQTSPIKSPVSMLNEYCMRQRIQITYSWVNEHDVEVNDLPTYLCQGKCVDTYGYGRGRTKQIAKRNAAADLVDQLFI